MCVYESMCICLCIYIGHYHRLVIKYHQPTLQANNYIDWWLHKHQQNNHQHQKNNHIDGWWNLVNSAGAKQK